MQRILLTSLFFHPLICNSECIIPDSGYKRCDRVCSEEPDDQQVCHDYQIEWNCFYTRELCCNELNDRFGLVWKDHPEWLEQCYTYNCYVPSVDLTHCYKLCQNVSEDGDTCLDKPYNPTDNTPWTCTIEPEFCCQQIPEIISSEDDCMAGLCWVAAADKVSCMVDYKGSGDSCYPTAAHCCASSSTIKSSYPADDVGYYVYDCIEASTNSNCIVPSADEKYCNKTCNIDYVTRDGHCWDTQVSWTCMDSVEGCCSFHSQISQAWDNAPDWAEKCEGSPCYIPSEDLTHCYRQCQHVSDDGLSCLDEPYNPADNTPWTCKPTPEECCNFHPEITNTVEQCMVGPCYVAAPDNVSCVLQEGGSGDECYPTPADCCANSATIKQSFQDDDGVYVLMCIQNTDWQNAPPECKDLVYNGGDALKSNFHCMQACIDNGGLVDSADHDSECWSQPANWDEDTDTTWVFDGDCYGFWSYGYTPSQSTTSSSYSGKVTPVATPAICQGYCQMDKLCFNWVWEKLEDGSFVCSLKTQEQVLGAVNQVINLDGPDVEIDPNFCDPSMQESCRDGLITCLTCPDLNGPDTAICAPRVLKGYTGWKFCSMTMDVCTGTDFFLAS